MWKTFWLYDFTLFVLSTRIVRLNFINWGLGILLIDNIINNDTNNQLDGSHRWLMLLMSNCFFQFLKFLLKIIVSWINWRCLNCSPCALITFFLNTVSWSIYQNSNKKFMQCAVSLSNFSYFCICFNPLHGWLLLLIHELIFSINFIYWCPVTDLYKWRPRAKLLIAGPYPSHIYTIVINIHFQLIIIFKIKI